MNEQTIFDAIGALPDRFLEEAAAKPIRHTLRWGLIAACLVLIVGLIGGIHLYRTPVAYVSIDVNPSLELGLNRWDRVVEVTAYNADAEAICDTVNLKHLSYADALQVLLGCDALKAYLGENSDLTVTVVSDHASELCETTEACEAYQQHDGQLHHSDYDTLTEAHENACSVGKYAVYQELTGCDSSVTLDDCRDKTMHELHEAIEAHEHSSEEHHEDVENHPETEHHETSATHETECETEPVETSKPTSSHESAHHGENHH